MSIDPEFDPFRAASPASARVYMDLQLIVQAHHQKLRDQFVGQFEFEPTITLADNSFISFLGNESRVSGAIEQADALQVHVLHSEQDQIKEYGYMPDSTMVVGLELFRDGSPYMRDIDLIWGLAHGVEGIDRYSPNSYDVLIVPEDRTVMVHHHTLHTIIADIAKDITSQQAAEGQRAGPGMAVEKLKELGYPFYEFTDDDIVVLAKAVAEATPSLENSWDEYIDSL